MFDTYIQLDSIKGESTDEKHKEWITVLSFSHGVSQHASGSTSSGISRSAGKADIQDFNFTKVSDLATPYLNKHCCQGTHIAKAVVECCKSTGNAPQVFLKYTFDDVVITSVSIGGGQGQEHPMETVSFCFGKITWDYNSIDHTGKKKTNMTANHDLATNKGG